MAAISTVVMAAGVAASAASAANQMAAAKNAERQSEIAASNASYQGMLQNQINGIEADQVAMQTDEEINKIRGSALAIRSQQSAQAAASGIVVGEGSAQAIRDNTARLAHSDVLATIFSGVNKEMSIRTGGRMSEQAAINRADAIFNEGQDRAAGLRMSAGATLLSAAGKVGSEYLMTSKTAAPTK